jgi:glutamate-ammonia-ligase adenylyltransferase
MSVVSMDRPGTTGESLAARIDEASDRADAARRADRVLTAIGRPAGAPTEVEAHVLGLASTRAPYLATLLARDPDRLARVAADPYLQREKPAEVLVAALAAATASARSAAELARALRWIRADELVRLGVRELELGLATEVGRELARLAGACFDAALAFHDRALRARFGAPRERTDAGVERDATLVVIGMGKLGGDELNFSSDVDVIYVYSSDHGAAGPLSLHEYFAKLAAAVTAAVGEVTEDDIVFRVDLRLRPEGTQGAIANSLAQLERYYETFGRPWERQAWLKARPCAGDGRLGAEVMATMRPFVYPRHTAAGVVGDVLELNRRIKRELLPDPVKSATAARAVPGPRMAHGAAQALAIARAARGRVAATSAPAAAVFALFDLKNGVGGIREIEFFVQALQLVHARNPNLRARGTLAALDQLLFAGLVTDDEHLALGRAYRWLRHVEHVVQLDSGRQTQRVPAEVGARTLVARRVGYAGLAEFEADLARHTGAVAALFATLDAPGERDHVDAGDPVLAAARAVLAGDLGGPAQVALAQLGFADPIAAAAELGRARLRPDAPLGDAHGPLGAALLAEIATSADPDQALRHAVDLGARRTAAWSIWRLLDDNRPLLRLLVSLLGASEYLARSLVDRPELIDLLVAVGATPPDAAEIAADADRKLAVARAADPDDLELAWSALAEHKNGQVLRVALADFAGRLDTLAVCAELTAIAEVSLERALDLVWAGMRARHGRPRAADGTPATLAILGLGKLGGRELGYAADLDVVFVYSADGASDGAHPLDNIEYFTRVAQRLMTALHARTPRGRLYEVDTRLRPAGAQGLLVSSLTAWQRYHDRDAQLWEHQALTKLRPVAGDAAVAAAAEITAAVWTRPHDRRAVADAVAEMRARIERELGSPADLKAGRGGIIDVEFAAQCAQLAFAAEHPALRTPSTTAALAAAATAGVIAAGDAALLADGYRFLRHLEHRLRIVHDRPVHHLPAVPLELERLARRAGFPDGPRLTRALDRWRDDIRGAYLRVVAAVRGA